MDLEDRHGNVPATNNRLSTLDDIGGGAALWPSSRTLASQSGKRPHLFYAIQNVSVQYLSYYFDNMAILPREYYREISLWRDSAIDRRVFRIADNFDQSSSWWAQKQGHATISERLFEHGGLPFDPSRHKDGMDRRMPIVLRVTVVRPSLHTAWSRRLLTVPCHIHFRRPLLPRVHVPRPHNGAEAPVARVELRSVYRQGHAYRTRNQIASAGEYAALDRTRGGNSAHHSSSTQESPPPSILERGRRL
ncbi:hypothetical protein PG991_011745 [Apiospora marii]|uniref:Uncharacterized protein n=1 Tax=Apiospora marii TaxID=335849 RepID=A0ABR1RF29_9PEZI